MPLLKKKSCPPCNGDCNQGRDCPAQTTEQGLDVLVFTPRQLDNVLAATAQSARADERLRMTNLLALVCQEYGETGHRVERAFMQAIGSNYPLTH